MSYTTKIHEESQKFLETPDSDLKPYQEYKDALVKIFDSLTPGELVDFAIHIRKYQTI